MKEASLSRIRPEVLMRDEPSAIDFAQDAGATTTASRFLAADEPLPPELIVTSGDVIRDRSPHDVVKAKNLVFDHFEGFLKSRLGRSVSDEGVLREDKHRICRDMRSDPVPRMRVQRLDVGGESGGVVHRAFSG